MHDMKAHREVEV